jgi:hypothetical protein
VSKEWKFGADIQGQCRYCNKLLRPGEGILGACCDECFNRLFPRFGEGHATCENCAAIIPSGRRFCDKCATERNRKSKREHMRRKRRNG